MFSHILSIAALLLDIGNAETAKMENTNYYLLRSILGFPKSVSYDFLIKLVNIKSLEQRKQFRSLAIVYVIQVLV